MSDKRRRTGPDGRKTAKAAAIGAVKAAPIAGAAGGKVYTGRIFWVAAFVLILTGYLLLGKADPGGQNAWAIVSPALLLAGYLLCIPAIIATYRN
ncbi:MAG: hypothetical protein A2234_01830 [Elusimicrobia bacterium RIFOXYA2_FULL_58_8]|nr:MAG: hypothetical protein A2234_01830 [Elusimicrobia bacterium RIFOXYA2_FULL_58_8]OGS13402.1 MAG: hypothetical protein A2285_09100 [Elusimicrobia bacterium RIFOXYA12_FULL_57_11]